MRFALLLAAPFLLAASGDMSVATFLKKAEGLRSKGAMALFSSDLGVLKREGEGAGKRWRASMEADKRAGRKPSACPPKEAKMTSTDFLNMMRAVPAAERGRTSVATAFTRGMARRYPCRG